MKRDEVTLDFDNGPFDPLIVIKLNGVRIGCVRKTGKGWITRGSFAGYKPDSFGETYFFSNQWC